LKYEQFKTFLERNDLSLKEFSELTNLSYSGCNKWKYSELPGWVESWCNLYEENSSLNNIKTHILKICKNNVIQK